jgi:hypothetical protein
MNRAVMKNILCLLTVFAIGFSATNVFAGGAEERMKARMAIEQIYHDVLGRSPSGEEIDNAIIEIKRGRSLKEIRKHTIVSEECERAIQKIYREVLNRKANDEEVQKVRKALNDGKTLVHLRYRLQKKGGL